MQAWLLTQLLTINNVVFGAGGENTRNWGQNIVKAGINVILGVGGLVLVGRGAFDIVKGWFNDNKDWKRIGMGVLTVIVGGALIAWSVANLQKFANNLGGDFNLTN